MKTITVDLEVFLGCSCWGGWNGDNQTVNLEVEDDIADTLQTMLDNAEPDEDGEIYISDEELWDAVQNGHPELEPLHDELAHRCHMMEVVYWCNEAYDCIDESLEPHFYEDVENGEYEPEPDDDYDSDDEDDEDEVDDEDDEDEVDDEDDEDEGELDFYACRDNYLAWVRSHTDDPYFMAERLGIEPGECDGEYSFHIKEIK